MTSDKTDPQPTDARKRLLVVTYHAPPSGGVGGLRWWGLSRHLARRGWRVHVVTANPQAEKASRPASMSVEGLPPRSTLGTRYRRWRTGDAKDVGAANREVSGTTSGGRRPYGALRSLRRELGGLLVFPDHGRGWLFRAAGAVRRSITSFQPRIVVSTGPPHSVHLALRAGLAWQRPAWVADFRDPWSDEARLHLDVAWAGPLQTRMEAGVIRCAQRVLTTTPELASVYRERFPEAWVDCLPNGADLEGLPRWTPDRSAGLSVVHLGTLYHRRDPIPAVRAFALFLRQHPEAAAGSALRFVGHVENDFRLRIQAAARSEGIENRVKVMGLRPREEALKILARSGLSLVLAQDQETAVPAKIYESVGMGVPTLVITEPESATGAAARRLGAAVHLPTGLEAIAAAMQTAWSGHWTGEPATDTRLDYAELAEDAERLLLETLERGGETM